MQTTWGTAALSAANAHWTQRRLVIIQEFLMESQAGTDVMRQQGIICIEAKRKFELLSNFMLSVVTETVRGPGSTPEGLHIYSKMHQQSKVSKRWIVPPWDHPLVNKVPLIHLNTVRLYNKRTFETSHFRPGSWVCVWYKVDATNTKD